MSEKTGIEKLRILLPHWIDHNNNHIAEFIKWRQIVADEEGDREVVELLGEAVATMEKSGKILAEALEKLGGSSEEGHHHHHH
ncbi:MAG: hypothetical protein LC633_03045 [Desulfobulbaceae bacterium]|nr:hypothetical protein [Desulfobulbaceae bacterium]